MINWIKVDLTEKLPEFEVLACNASRDTLIGHLYLDGDDDSKVVCESPNELLLNVTHYVPITFP